MRDIFSLKSVIVYNIVFPGIILMVINAMVAVRIVKLKSISILPTIQYNYIVTRGNSNFLLIIYTKTRFLHS